MNCLTSFSSTADLAWRTILTAQADNTAITALRTMFDGYDYSESQELTNLHKIVLKIDKRPLIEYLQICSKSEIDRTDKSGQTALHWAAARFDLFAVQNLLNVHADPDVLSKNAYSALHYTSSAGNSKVVRCLLKAGVQVDRCGEPFRGTALNYMLGVKKPGSGPSIECMNLLMDAGARVDSQDAQGCTGLVYASQHNDFLALKVQIRRTQLLLNRQANVNKKTFIGETALFVAVQWNSHACLRILLNHGADLTVHSGSGRSILHEAAEYSDLKTLKILISARIRGLKINGKTSEGGTPLQLSQKREDPPEWHTSFADLLASVDERPPKTSKPINYQKLTVTATSALKSTKIQLYNEVRQVHEYIAKAPRPLIAVLRALLVLLVAFVWCLP